MQSLDALADGRIRDDRKPRKCSGCSLTTYDPSGRCSACQNSNRGMFTWYAVVTKPCKLKCNMHGTCTREVIAVEHGRREMTGNHACAMYAKVSHLPVHAGKDGSATGHYAGRAGVPRVTGGSHMQPIRHPQLDPFKEQTHLRRYSENHAA